MNSGTVIGPPKSPFSWVFDIGLHGKQDQGTNSSKQYLGPSQHQADGVRVTWPLGRLATASEGGRLSRRYTIVSVL